MMWDLRCASAQGVSSKPVQGGLRARFVHICDAVVPLDTGLGTWRQAGVVDAAALHAVPKSLPMQAAAMMVIKCDVP